MLTPDADRTDETHSNIDSTIFLALAPVTGLSLSVPRLDSALASEWHAGYGHHTHTMQMHTPRGGLGAPARCELAHAVLSWVQRTSAREILPSDLRSVPKRYKWPS